MPVHHQQKWGSLVCLNVYLSYTFTTALQGGKFAVAPQLREKSPEGKVTLLWESCNAFWDFLKYVFHTEAILSRAWRLKHQSCSIMVNHVHCLKQTLTNQPSTNIFTNNSASNAGWHWLNKNVPACMTDSAEQWFWSAGWLLWKPGIKLLPFFYLRKKKCPTFPSKAKPGGPYY